MQRSEPWEVIFIVIVTSVQNHHYGYGGLIFSSSLSRAYMIIIINIITGGHNHDHDDDQGWLRLPLLRPRLQNTDGAFYFFDKDQDGGAICVLKNKYEHFQVVEYEKCRCKFVWCCKVTMMVRWW